MASFAAKRSSSAKVNFFFLVLVCQFIVDFVPHSAEGCNGAYSDFCDTAEEALAEEIERKRNFTNLTPPPQQPTLPLLLHPHQRVKRGAKNFLRGERLLSDQISTILNHLFDNGYDRQIRPQLGGEPLEVTVNMAIRSMGNVDEQKQTFSLDCYFRQFWRDTRLKYNSTSRLDELPMNWQFLYKIWRPDTYIVNGKDSYLHKMTVPNRFIRIAPDGMISYSQRLTVKARCQMDLHKFPLDYQECPLEIGSFGHEARDIIYKWLDNPVSMDDDVSLAQYVMIDHTHGDFMGIRRSRNISTVMLSFRFQRQQGFYLLQIYIPLTLIVMCSWVTFFLVKTEKGSEIPARTGLGASSVLSVVTIGFGGKSKPQVGYATALDVFIILCFVNVFAALIEFAFMNFLDTLVRRLKRKDNESKLVMLMAQHEVMGTRMPKIPKRQESTMDTDGICGDEDIMSPEESSSEAEEETVFGPGGGRATCPHGYPMREGQRLTKEQQRELARQLRAERDCGTKILDAIIDFLTFFNCFRSVRSMEIYRKPHVVFNRVDRCCRRLFPLAFVLINLLYWIGYMYW